MTATLAPLADLLTSARAAQRRWAALPVRERLRPVERFRRLLVDRCDELCSVVSAEVGKPTVEVVSGEILPAADACAFLQRQAKSILAPRSVSSGNPLWMFGSKHVVHRRPRGVVGVIGTWNYPLFLNAGQILAALVAGNAVLWKPSEVTPRFASLLGELLRDSGVPEGLLHVLPATREMGPALADSGVDHVVFTGSAEVGRRLAARLGERLVSSTLELSGCDMLLLLPDADVPLAARAAWFGVTLNAGQTCIAVRRVFVHESRYDAFCEQMRPLAESAAPVRLALANQARHLERVVADARERGARLLAERPITSGDRECLPVALADARPEMAVCREASFAPVLAVIRYGDLGEVLEAEQGCSYALAASVFTRDLAEGQRIAALLRAGHVSINEVIVPTAHPMTPFGGRGDSGWGVTQGAEGLLEMTVPQAVSVVGGRFRPYYDLTDPKKHAPQEELLRGMLEATHAPGWARRLRGWWRVARRAWRGLD